MKKTKTLMVIAMAAITFVTKAEAQKKPPPPPPPPAPIYANIDAQAKKNEFLKNNPAVKNIYWEKKNLVVELKNGKVEKYNVADSNEKKNFVDKYGDLPKFPPPPPIPPPPPPPPPKNGAI